MDRGAWWATVHALHRPRRSEISTRWPASPGEAGWGLALAGRAPACVGAGGEPGLRGEQPGPVTGGGGNGVRVGGRSSMAGLQETCSATRRSWLHRRLLGIAYKRRGDHEPESERATTTLWH